MNWYKESYVDVRNSFNPKLVSRIYFRVCSLLDGYVSKILISFIDNYKNVRKSVRIINHREFTENDYMVIGKSFSKSAHEHNIIVHTCFEDRNLVEYGFEKGECLSHELAYKLTGKVYKKEWGARKEKKCHCVQMVDIGVYNSCKHFCKYCYANYDEKAVFKNVRKHDDLSPMLTGNVTKKDSIKERKD